LPDIPESIARRGAVVVTEQPARLFTEGFFADPYPAYRTLRDDLPVCRTQQPDGLEIWLVSRYDDVRAALVDSRLAHDLRRAEPILRAAGVLAGSSAAGSPGARDRRTTDRRGRSRSRGTFRRGP
jgi:cytochrome P450